MKPKLLFLLVLLLAAVGVLLMRPSGPPQSGFSFAHPGGDCVVWYSRNGSEILDILIAPRATFGACYSAGRRRLRMGEEEVTFGETHRAYIFDAGKWRTEPLKDLSEADLPSVIELEKCRSTSEVAAKILRP
jgi:hypothetical protein